MRPPSYDPSPSTTPSLPEVPSTFDSENTVPVASDQMNATHQSDVGFSPRQLSHGFSSSSSSTAATPASTGESLSTPPASVDGQSPPSLTHEERQDTAWMQQKAPSASATDGSNKRKRKNGTKKPLKKRLTSTGFYEHVHAENVAETAPGKYKKPKVTRVDGSLDPGVSSGGHAFIPPPLPTIAAGPVVAATTQAGGRQPSAAKIKRQQTRCNAASPYGLPSNAQGKKKSRAPSSQPPPAQFPKTVPSHPAPYLNEAYETCTEEFDAHTQPKADLVQQLQGPAVGPSSFGVTDFSQHQEFFPAIRGLDSQLYAAGVTTAPFTLHPSLDMLAGMHQSSAYTDNLGQYQPPLAQPDATHHHHYAQTYSSVSGSQVSPMIVNYGAPRAVSYHQSLPQEHEPQMAFAGQTFVQPVALYADQVLHLDFTPRHPTAEGGCYMQDLHQVHVHEGPQQASHYGDQARTTAPHGGMAYDAWVGQHGVEHAQFL
ncbi:hypothetical protein NLJ89_g6646 [Agrocybe chaxingu]|uniref:Uncharacterized protein n=1 Tax=Agrocybe chaxingu TaxID=84603 RepID=A0A9W8JYS8_9AGAR|nr:hypothetical protein NLJ89_g6646 [Agrocybe chaxingu]